MQLVQKRFLWGTTVFEIKDDILHVGHHSLLKSSSHEIPLNSISPNISKLKRFPLGWFLIASISSITFVFGVTGIFFVEGDGQLGCGALVLMAGFFSALCWYGFFERKLDFIILNSKECEAPLVYIYRTLPTERHAEEFVEIVRERIDSTKLL